MSSTDAIDILLDADGDLDLSTGDVQFTRGAGAVQQGARLRIALIKGEYELDLDEGTDWLNLILVKNPNLPAINVHLRERLLGTPFVSEVQRMAIQFDAKTREATISALASTDFGDSVITVGVTI